MFQLPKETLSSAAMAPIHSSAVSNANSSARKTVETKITSFVTGSECTNPFQVGCWPWKLKWKVKIPYEVAFFTWLLAKEASFIPTSSKVNPALSNMVVAAKLLRTQLASTNPVPRTNRATRVIFTTFLGFVSFAAKQLASLVVSSSVESSVDSYSYSRKVLLKPLPFVLCSRPLSTDLQNSFMNGLSKSGHTQKTFDLLRVMEQGSTNPNEYIYNIVIDALCKDRMLDAAISLFEEMKQKGIPLDIVTYNSLIDGLCKFDGLCKEGKVEDAEEVMRHMIEKGVEPNVVTYNVIIDGYCLRGQMDRARRLFDSMIDKSIEPTIISFNILINGYCKKKKLDEAMHLFRVISRNGPKPNIVTYSTILQGLFEVGRTDFADKFFAEMLSTGLKPNICTNGILLGGYFLNGRVEKALLLFHELERKKEYTDIELYGIVIAVL
ncbi:putative pentatricopeptide repeat-containing protein, mitochondrial [Nicotiana attenuata]|uniref:Pentatricopeptide repeat-containing protein, mitochondrial n=1 Tax=Nicotiana attenuata TaxID=49451 RepID=A0A1J6ITH8_NICAT|nr:putative pentatricopeptide repeat-containing protein, mitochondrial [Nicotiana attenuata]